MKTNLLIQITIAFLLHSSSLFSQNHEYAKKELTLMGCKFQISAVAEDLDQAWQAVEAGISEIVRIEKLISSWDPASQTSLININAGIRPVLVDEELIQLIIRSKKISALTEGAFDISFASMDKIWSFNKQIQEFPNSEVIEEASKLIGYENIICNTDESKVFLTKKGMRIGFGGIGKGYAANRAIQIMQKYAIGGALVNASGDIMTWGISLNNSDWQVTIADPKDINSGLASLRIENSAIVTSGNYEKYLIHEGSRYAHIIDPRTGYPTTGIKSVTIVSKDAEISDALATSLFVLGISDGLKLINKLKDTDCLIIDDTDTIHTSKNLNINYY